MTAVVTRLKLTALDSLRFAWRDYFSPLVALWRWVRWFSRLPHLLHQRHNESTSTIIEQYKALQTSLCQIRADHEVLAKQLAEITNKTNATLEQTAAQLGFLSFRLQHISSALGQSATTAASRRAKAALIGYSMSHQDPFSKWRQEAGYRPPLAIRSTPSKSEHDPPDHEAFDQLVRTIAASIKTPDVAHRYRTPETFVEEWARRPVVFVAGDHHSQLTWNDLEFVKRASEAARTHESTVGRKFQLEAGQLLGESDCQGAERLLAEVANHPEPDRLTAAAYMALARIRSKLGRTREAAADARRAARVFAKLGDEKAMYEAYVVLACDLLELNRVSAAAGFLRKAAGLSDSAASRSR